MEAVGEGQWRGKKEVVAGGNQFAGDLDWAQARARRWRGGEGDRAGGPRQLASKIAAWGCAGRRGSLIG